MARAAWQHWRKGYEATTGAKELLWDDLEPNTKAHQLQKAAAQLSALEESGYAVVPKDLGADYILQNENGKREPVYELRGRVRDVYATLIAAASLTHREGE